MNIDKMKKSIIDEVENQRRSLKEISRKIHSNPELGFHEEQAAELLTDYLKENGFTVERGICQLPTAFKAVYGERNPSIAILAEYDSLPESSGDRDSGRRIVRRENHNGREGCIQ